MNQQHELTSLPSQLPRIAWLHVGKTGGTALGAMIAEHNRRIGSADMVLLSHGFTLSAARRRFPTARIGFFVRDPVTRFVSGFLSRRRQGRPRYDFPWSDAEAVAFGRFKTPESLALALGDNAAEAFHAVDAILHLRQGLAFYLEGTSVLQATRDHIAWIGQTEMLDVQLPVMRRRLGMDQDIQPPRDDVGAHRNPVTNAGLSPRAATILRDFLHQEYRLREVALQMSEDLMRQDRSESPRPDF